MRDGRGYNETWEHRKSLTDRYYRTKTVGLILLATYTLLQSPESPPVVVTRPYDLFFFLVGCFSPLDSTRQVDYFVSYVLRSSRSGSGMCAFLTYWTAFRFFYFFFYVGGHSFYPRP